MYTKSKKMEIICAVLHHNARRLYSHVNLNVYRYDGELKVKAIFKLRGNRDREELAHCAVLTMPVEEFSHVQYSALP